MQHECWLFDRPDIYATAIIIVVIDVMIVFIMRFIVRTWKYHSSSCLRLSEIYSLIFLLIDITHVFNAVSSFCLCQPSRGELEERNGLMVTQMQKSSLQKISYVISIYLWRSCQQSSFVFISDAQNFTLKKTFLKLLSCTWQMPSTRK